ncbi:Gfo/Idh/MocA family protein [Candidatus Hydrogenedentota bacterium]
MSELRVGVVGGGHFGRYHTKNYGEHPKANLVGVADTNMEVANRVANEFGCRALGSYEELIDQVDAVSVAVPTQFHYDIAAAMLDAGKHVLLEKPMTVNLEEADSLMEKAEESSATLQIGHVERFNRAVQKLSTVMTSPLFVEAHRMSPFPERSSDVTVILDLMIHDLDIILYLVNSPLVSVDAVGVPVLSPKVDIANARLRFENGCVANVTTSRVSFEAVRKFRVFEPAAYMSLDYKNQQIMRYTMRDGATIEPGRMMEAINVENVPVDKAMSLELEIDSFVECILTGSEPVVTAQDGRDVLKLALDISDCITKGSVCEY